jgi:hypothetical protein
MCESRSTRKLGWAITRLTRVLSGTESLHIDGMAAPRFAVGDDGWHVVVRWSVPGGGILTLIVTAHGGREVPGVIWGTIPETFAEADFGPTTDGGRLGKAAFLDYVVESVRAAVADPDFLAAARTLTDQQ